jgi:hypothetical protein
MIEIMEVRKGAMKIKYLHMNLHEGTKVKKKQLLEGAANKHCGARTERRKQDMSKKEAKSSGARKVCWMLH